MKAVAPTRNAWVHQNLEDEARRVEERDQCVIPHAAPQ